jgi:hypothetical protein
VLKEMKRRNKEKENSRAKKSKIEFNFFNELPLECLVNILKYFPRDYLPLLKWVNKKFKDGVYISLETNRNITPYPWKYELKLDGEEMIEEEIELFFMTNPEEEDQQINQDQDQNNQNQQILQDQLPVDGNLIFNDQYNSEEDEDYVQTELNEVEDEDENEDEYDINTEDEEEIEQDIEINGLNNEEGDIEFEIELRFTNSHRKPKIITEDYVYKIWQKNVLELARSGNMHQINWLLLNQKIPKTYYWPVKNFSFFFFILYYDSIDFFL